MATTACGTGGTGETSTTGGTGETSTIGGTGEDGLGDLDALYRSLSRRLERIVRFEVRAPQTVIEDACQSAWSRLVLHRGELRRDVALAWLARTARREAMLLVRRGTRELSLDAEAPGAGVCSPLIAPAPAELVEQRERLGALGLLPARQQRLLWLRGLGLSYDEIASRERCTTRTVERQLFMARTSLGSVEAAC